MATFKVLTLNAISLAGLERLPRDRYEVASEMRHPDAILVRSADMHDMPLPASLKAVARAGAGVNNIPVAKLSRLGVPVFTAPGANANAVMELVVAGMLLAARDICAAWDFVRGLDGSDETLSERVEREKKRFVGFELAGRTLGIIGLGAVGLRVANAATRLGLKVVGYDPDISVRSAWQLSADVRQATSVGDLLASADFVSLHVPLIEETRHLINAERLRQLPRGAVLLNFSRESVADEQAVRGALDEGRLRAYVTDFPRAALRGHPRAIMLPHIGASTREAEENCAVMVAEQLRAFLEDGEIHNTVNFPEVSMQRSGGYRIAVVNANVPNMLGQISTTLANAGHNIIDMLNRSHGEIAYTLADVEQALDEVLLERVRSIDGVLNVRAL